MSGSDGKLQRWMDLIAALLARSTPVAFEELAREVADYATRVAAIERETDPRRQRTMQDTLKRTFERDKEELRSFGVPIESHRDQQGNDTGAYSMRRADFYLPYLCLALPDGSVESPPTVNRYGYRALERLVFSADELQALVDAAAVASRLGDPLLAADVRSAMRKLAIDLPLGTAAPSAADLRVIPGRANGSAEVFAALGDALERRRVVRFTYAGMASGQDTVREVRPYGLVFVTGHWYLVAHDPGRGALRKFRVHRIREVALANPGAPGPDYEIPASFSLRTHARARAAWLLGDEESFRVGTQWQGATATVSEEVQRCMPFQVCVSEAQVRTCEFEVRRIGPFVRWLLTLGGQLLPLWPEPVVRAYREECEAVAATHRVPPASPVPSPSTGRVPSRSGDSWLASHARAQLRRLLQLVPRLADGRDHTIAELAAAAGVPEATLWRDVHALVDRADAPAGFVERVQVYVEPDAISAVSGPFARPMRLTRSEVMALALGLAVLRAQRPSSEHVVLVSAAEELRQLLTSVEAARPDALTAEVAVDPLVDTPASRVIRDGMQGSRVVHIAYRKAEEAEAVIHAVEPHAVVAAGARCYLVAHSRTRNGVRFFRLDRVEEAWLDGEATFTPPGPEVLAGIEARGEMFAAPAATTMRVRYSPTVARWIAEREGLVPEADGALVVEHPVADEGWAIRHVMQYGREAELLHPPELRAQVAARAARMAAAEVIRESAGARGSG